MELAAKNDWNVIYAPFAAAMVYGSLADAVRVYRETCETGFKRPMRRAMCSYFVHIASTPEEENYGKEALVRYFQDALIAAFPSSSGEKVRLDLSRLATIDHTCAELLKDWLARRRAAGQAVTVIGGSPKTAAFAT
eukprot:gene21011-26952_t